MYVGPTCIAVFMYRLFVVDFSPKPLQSICIFITRQSRYMMANEDIEIQGGQACEKSGNENNDKS